LAVSGRGAELGHGNTRWIPPDLEAKAQHHENGVGGLPSQQEESQTWAESQLQQRNPALLFRAEIPRSNFGQVVHVSPTPWVTSQEANITRRTPEAACWGAGATTLRTATLALSTAEYCAHVWCRTAQTSLIDPTINDALRIVTGCLRPTPADNLPILAGIQPAELRHSGTTLSLTRRAMEPGHLLHSALPRPSGAPARRLKSRHPFVPAAQQLISFSDNNNIRASQWADHQWNAEWADNPTRLRTSIPDSGTHTPGMTLPRKAWVRPNHLRTGVGRFCSCLCKWGMASSAACECGTEQTVSHVVLHCPIHRPLADYTAWRFWTMRQPNDCSTPAPISRRASSE